MSISRSTEMLLFILIQLNRKLAVWFSQLTLTNSRFFNLGFKLTSPGAWSSDGDKKRLAPGTTLFHSPNEMALITIFVSVQGFGKPQSRVDQLGTAGGIQPRGSKGVPATRFIDLGGMQIF